MKERGNLIINLHRLLDLCLTAVSFQCAYVIKKHDLLFLSLLDDNIKGLTTSPNYNAVLFLIIIIWYITFNFFDLYVSCRQQNFGQILWNTVKAILIGFVILIFAMYIFKIPHVSRIMLAIFIGINLITLGISKGTIYRLLSKSRQSEYNIRNLLIIGSGHGSKEIVHSVGNSSKSGYRIIGCLAVDRNRTVEKVIDGINVIGTTDDLNKILKEQVVDELVFSKPPDEINNAAEYIALAEEIGIDVRILPYWHLNKIGYNPTIGSIQVRDFLGIPALTLTSASKRSGELVIKSIFDYIAASIGLILFFPFFIITAIAIKTSSEGPVFFKQERLGLNGRKFMVYKFRTMTVDAEARHKEVVALNEADGPVFKIKKDPRIIPIVGTFLRATSLDELPQLINVIKGEMSLIGPRPPIPNEVEKYDVWQRRRLSMKPGMTCIWQITSNRNRVGFKEWMNMDLRYIDNWSLGLDFKILLKTLLVVITAAGR